MKIGKERTLIVDKRIGKRIQVDGHVWSAWRDTRDEFNDICAIFSSDKDRTYLYTEDGHLLGLDRRKKKLARHIRRLPEGFQDGDRIKVPFGAIPNAYKRGNFLYQNGKYGYFTHTNTGKKLRRPMGLIEVDAK